MKAGHHFSCKKQSCFLEPSHDIAIIFHTKNRAVSEHAMLGVFAIKEFPNYVNVLDNL
jgi:hypothetical protein